MTLPAQEPAQRKLVLVEGNDDLRFFKAMSRHLGINDVLIDAYNGKNNLRNDLSDRVRNPDFQTVSSLGIVRDADNSSQAAFDSVVSSLRRVNLPTPGTPVEPVEQDGLRVSVLIIPPDENTGELENVCLRSIEGSREMECVESYFTCMNDLAPPVAANEIAKARLHSYLSIGPVYTNNDGSIDRPGRRGRRHTVGQPGL